MIRPHDPLRQEEVPEQRGYQEILSEEPFEDVSREYEPSDSVGDRGEDPVELSEWGPSVLEVTRDFHDQVDSDLSPWVILVNVDA
jgi:hypothetical protein